MSKEEARRGTVFAEPSLEQWSALYAAAQSLNALAPWRALWDTDILTLRLPGREEPVFCSVMGQAGESLGIGIYQGYDAFARLTRMLEPGNGTPPEMLMLEQEYLVCYFGDREELDSRDREAIRELGLKFRGRNQWIFFRSIKPGRFPWYITGGEAELLAESLRNVEALCRCFLEGRLKPDFQGGETLVRSYSPEEKLWVNAVAPMPPIQCPVYVLELTDELLLARLKKQRKTRTHIELDAFYLPMPVQESRELPLRAAGMAMLADRDSGMILDQRMISPEKVEEGGELDLLVGYIQTYGRPAAVYVRGERNACLLRDICGKIGVRLLSGMGMPVINECYGQILRSFEE